MSWSYYLHLPICMCMDYLCVYASIIHLHIHTFPSESISFNQNLACLASSEDDRVLCGVFSIYIFGSTLLSPPCSVCAQKQHHELIWSKVSAEIWLLEFRGQEERAFEAFIFHLSHHWMTHTSAISLCSKSHLSRELVTLCSQYNSLPWRQSQEQQSCSDASKSRFWHHSL